METDYMERKCFCFEMFTQELPGLLYGMGTPGNGSFTDPLLPTAFGPGKTRALSTAVLGDGDSTPKP